MTTNCFIVTYYYLLSPCKINEFVQISKKKIPFSDRDSPMFFIHSIDKNEKEAVIIVFKKAETLSNKRKHQKLANFSLLLYTRI